MPDETQIIDNEEYKLGVVLGPTEKQAATEIQTKFKNIGSNMSMGAAIRVALRVAARHMNKITDAEFFELAKID